MDDLLVCVYGYLRSAILIFADRDLGFFRCSAAEGMIGFLVMIKKGLSGFVPKTSSTAVCDILPVLKKFFTILSSKL
jgi:hypothetical protein